VPYYLVEPMTLADIDSILVIEAQSFASPWSRQSYERDLKENDLSYYLVARQVARPASRPDRLPIELPAAWLASRRAQPPVAWYQRLGQAIFGPRQPLTPPARHSNDPIVGYAGVWMMVSDAHLVTIAVAPAHRRRGLGELLLIATLDLSQQLAAETMTLEVRVSNKPAQALYTKYGFETQGRRRHYYSDNGEDALIMTTPLLGSAEFQSRLQTLKANLLARLNRDWSSAIPDHP